MELRDVMHQIPHLGRSAHDQRVFIGPKTDKLLAFE
jgi:hypothetical protein